MNLDPNTLAAVITNTRSLRQPSRGSSSSSAATTSAPPAITHNDATYYRADLVTRVIDELLDRERLAVRMACETLHDNCRQPAAEPTCSGCDVRVGQRHWDNCPLVPAFSQPVFTGS